MKNDLYYIYWLIRTYPMRWNFPRYKILSFEETVNEIIQNKKSISRFGDGEFRLLLKEKSIYFQELNYNIAARLDEVLNSKLQNHLIALPSSFISRVNLKRDVKIHWLNFINLKGKQIAKQIKNVSYVFADALISRFYLDYENKMEVSKRIKLLQKIWDGKDVLIIEGELSRLGVGNDFFINSKSMERIICPATNAFTQYDQILNAAKEHGRNKLIVIALGPTATILSYDLAKENYWALDLGHIDIEYSWYLQKARTKVPIKGKKSAEVNGAEDFQLTDIEENIYKKSIIAKIS